MDKILDIIIPAYNAHNTLEKALHSIAFQHSCDIAHVTIVNDASDKDYQEIINKFKDILDIEELTLTERVSCGLTRQAGIDHTGLPFIMFMDADDILARWNSIDILLAPMASDNINVCYGGIQEALFKDNNFTSISPMHFTWVFGSVYRRSFLEEKNIRFADLSNGEDTNFNKQIKLLSPSESVYFENRICYIWTDYNKDNRINNDYFSRIDAKIGYLKSASMVYDKLEDIVPPEKIKMELLSCLYCIGIQCLGMINDKEAMEIVMPHVYDFFKKYYKKYQSIITDDDIQHVIDVNKESCDLDLFKFINLLEQHCSIEEI